MERRIKLYPGEQKKIIQNAVKKYGSLKNLAFKIDINYSSLKNYSCEAILLPENLFEKIIKLTGINKGNLHISYLSPIWGTSLGGKKGIRALEKKYPKKIIKWRKNALKKSRFYNTKKIKIPPLKEKLAEFIGVYLGDGTMTKYFIRISGDYRYDMPYFNYLSKLINNLFGIKASFQREKSKNTAYLTIFSKELCSFLNKEFQLKPGHKIKNNSKIPKKIIQNKKLSIACLRGLIDTDGSITRRGNQFSIQFTAHNKKLLDQVINLGKKLELFTFSDKTNTGTNKKENIPKYFQIVGSSNLRHIVRFHLKFYKNKTIYRREVIEYYEKPFYSSLTLPYKVGS